MSADVPDCPTCGGNSAVTATETADAISYRCAATYAHDDRAPRFWTVPKRKAPAPRAPRTPRAPGTAAAPKAEKAARKTGSPSARPTTAAVTHELTEPLLAVIQTLPAAWIEHGVIEYRLRQDQPELFGRHVAEAGHVLLGGGGETSGTTASGVRFATALLRLERAGSVTHYNAPPTGAAWQQDKLVGYWATRRPKPPQDQVLTWEQYATETLGREDGGWTDEDRTEIARLVAVFGRRR